ncbi:hypothetical protein [Nonomuraea rubra]|uniref:hypothetical protein n=1 Tax=Nonomuraea rubra TaxID=46180 RepID=UPI0031EF8EFF
MRALRRSRRLRRLLPAGRAGARRAYLTGETRIPGVHATPGKGTDVAALHPRLLPVRRAQLAAMLGLPYAFALALRAPPRWRRPSRSTGRVQAVGTARRAAYVIAALNVIAAETTRGGRGAVLTPSGSG